MSSFRESRTPTGYANYNRMRMGCDSTLCEKEVILDCGNCPYGYICCCAFDVALTDDEALRLENTVLSDGTKVLKRKSSGECFYFSCTQQGCTNKCQIWDERPEVCRKYSCLKDRRAICISSGSQPLQKQPNFGGRVRVCISVAVLDSESKHRTTPMMVHDVKSGLGGVCAVKTIEIVESPENAVKMAKDIVEQIINNRLGEES